MNDRRCDTLTRHASLLTLGTTGLVVLGRPFAVDAKSTAQKKARRKCKRQAGQCTTIHATGCAGNPDCLALGKRCCPIAGTCNITAFLTCIVNG